MSNGEVKRWQAPHMMRYRLPAERRSETDHATEAYAVPCSVVLASDHERIVAEKDAEIERLKRERAKYEADCKRIEYFDDLHEKVATQKRVIEKLKTYVQHRVDCICRAGVLQYSEECDCGLKAIEQGEGT